MNEFECNVNALLETYIDDKYLQWVSSEVDIPNEIGLYVLCMNLSTKQSIKVGAQGIRKLDAGSYLYIGSAKGPGGLSSRLGRHFTQSTAKKKRWHIDYLREIMQVVGSWIIFNKNQLDENVGITECELVRIVACINGTKIIEDLGSSDCRCKGHVIYFAED